MHIQNSDGQQQTTILKEELPGFIFESNRNTKHSFTAETSLGPEYHSGWSGRKGKRFKSKIEAIKQKVCFLFFSLNGFFIHLKLLHKYIFLHFVIFLNFFLTFIALIFEVIYDSNKIVGK